MNPQAIFTPAEVQTIRAQYAARTLDVRMWADSKRCGLETVRRIARGDTYRHAGGPAVHHRFGGMQAAPTQVPQPDGEVDEAELAASFARLQAAMLKPTPEDAQSALATSLLDELQGGAGFVESSPSGNTKLG